MRLCFSCSYEEKEEITPEDSVENLKSTIAKKKGIDTRYVHLIHKGRVLHNGKRLADYGVASDSLIHVVTSKPKASSDFVPSPRKEEDGVSVESPICQDAQKKVTENGVQEGDDYGETMIASIITHVFGDIVDYAKENGSIVVNTKSITDFLTSEPGIVKTALQTPLLQDLLSDTTCVRQLLLSNSTISQLIVNNPGLKDFIDRDDKLRELTEAISDTTNFCDFKHLQQIIIQKVEHAIGNQLRFGNSTSQTPSTPTSPNPSPCTINEPPPQKEDPPSPITAPNLWNATSEENRDRRDDHIALLCQLIAHRPDVVRAFMKRTPIYKRIAKSRPELLDDLLKPERIRLMGKPEVIRALIKVDKALQKAIRKS
ncbi:hypothetical protein WA577_002266 [Blastocystis sp. JDR]